MKQASIEKTSPEGWWHNCHFILPDISYNGGNMETKPLSIRFQDKLLLYSQTEDMGGRRQIEEDIWAEYGAEYAVFVLDMSGFSLMTRKYGIVHYLSMVRRMQLTTEPIVKSYGGKMIKYEADNCFAVFPDPLSAVNAAIAMQHAFPPRTC